MGFIPTKAYVPNISVRPKGATGPSVASFGKTSTLELSFLDAKATVTINSDLCNFPALISGSSRAEPSEKHQRGSGVSLNL